ncbi:HNH endonuclease signature motif containing protein [Microbacterium oleivorans]|uniref:HNH endonuclease signature motif containing protein n=1 Tax=Microbacterium oleivorans TaxID=273677 RepID=UPI00203C64AB|nr:HNH endonuclease signature motif containing protein [Microbacterium oleivorans]MCM3697292.1 HNH endonuclease [Microbacterium oleivorans]
MTDRTETPGGEDYLAALAGIVADVGDLAIELARVQIRELRALAAAGRLAEAQTAQRNARVQVHDMALRSIAAEVGGVMRVTDRTVQRRIGEARTLIEGFPATVEAWEQGRIVRGHAFLIVETGMALPAEMWAEFEAVAITRCEQDTPNRVRGELEILAHRMHPRSFAERHEEAAAGRCVRLVPGRDGMSDLIANLPTVIAEGIHDRLTQQARAIIDTRDERAVARAGNADVAVIATDTRSTDQVRADVFADLVLSGTPALDDTRDTTAGPLGAIRARVQILVPAATLTGDDDGPCDLAGRSPIDPATARTLAGGTGMWERLFHDPTTGITIATDSYRVPSGMRRFLQARDQHCRFPGCRTAAIRCEIDHTHDHALGGRTELSNLAHLCQRHHSMKQFTAWTVRQLTGGVLEWTSPLGRTYREDAPTPAVAFSPAAPPPPPAPTAPAGPAPF